MQSLILVFALTPILAFSSMAEIRLHSMTLDEKIGQLFVIPVCPKRDSDHFRDVERMMRDYHIGSVIMKQATPQEQVKMLNKIGPMTKDGLLVMQDAEWGLGMRMDETVSFPKNLTLGALQDDDLIYKMGKLVGEELRMVGAHINLAPVVDLYSPIMQLRSFGSDPEKVAKKGIAMMRGLMAGGVVPVAKHFPGHGEIDHDSHCELPTIRNLERGLYAFQKLIDAGVPAIMTGHFTMPLEKKMDLLRRTGFKGIVITDALNMRGITKYFPTDEIAISHVLTGHDLLLYGDHIAPNIDNILRVIIPKAFAAIRNSVPEDVINQHVLKILKFKEQVGATRFTPIPAPFTLIRPESLALRKEIFRKAITKLENGQIITYESEPESLEALKEAEAGKLKPEGKMPYML